VVRRTALNLLLLVAVAVLAAVAIFQPGVQEPPPAPTLTDRDPGAVQRVRIERPEQPPVVLEKRAGRWYVAEPLSMPANAFRIQSLLEVLSFASDRQFATQDLDLPRFGLAPPKASLFLDDLRLDFGDTESLSGRRYVRSGEAVHLIADRFYHQVMAGAPGFAHLGPLGPDPEPVALDLPDLTLRHEGGRWVVEPDDPAAGADAVQRLVDAWRSVQAITVRPLEAAAGGRSLTVALQGQEAPLRFLVSETPHALVLARPEAGVQYHLPVESAERLLRLRPPASPPETATEAGAAEPAKPDGEGGDLEEPPEGAEGSPLPAVETTAPR
jgi:hypothetical protein